MLTYKWTDWTDMICPT